MKNQVTTGYSCLLLLCILGLLCILSFFQGVMYISGQKKHLIKSCLHSPTVEVTIHSYYKYNAKSGSKKLKAYF